MSDNISHLIGLIKKVLNNQYFAVLASVEQGQPYSNLVAFAAAEDLKSLFFITNRNTRKYKNIQANNRVSLLIDNRTNQPADLSKALAITVIGSASTEKANNYQRSVFLAKNPNLREFISSPDNAFIVVSVDEYIIAGFAKTQRIVMNSK